MSFDSEQLMIFLFYGFKYVELLCILGKEIILEYTISHGWEVVIRLMSN